MLKLNEILNGIEFLCQQGNDALPVDGIRFDSRAIRENDVFFAVKGAQVDGHRFIGRAVERGARAIVCRHIPADVPNNITVIIVKNVNAALGIAASNFYGTPSRHLKLVGVTGTNGKTTIATSLFRLFRKLGFGAGLLSTIQNQINDKVIATTHTTPDAARINRLMRQMVQEGCEYCFMEVSSHALTQHRVAGLEFTGGIFSNLSQDHLDYHATLDQYLKAKKSFFDHLPRDAFALVNTDDPNAKRMLEDCAARGFHFSMEKPADFTCHVLESHFGGMRLRMDSAEVQTSFIGEFNACNLLAVYASAVLLGQPKDRVLRFIGGLGDVAGRFESVRSVQGVTAIIDYAHTPDALRNVLETIEHIRNGKGQVITVVGAGGDRDRTKRPAMARIAAQLSDRVILTSDNPRSEDPNRILDDMRQGIAEKNEGKVMRIPDRKQAIKTALQLAGQGDIVLVAGKGHETYQEVKGIRNHFDDKEVVAEIFRGAA
uniref:UDP-N-acetylmuramoyl-L-alanyl-D-glutamate--2,6-diaminopimelate ligase n=1 Tax=Candidatus Kentrum sp. LPFa TaxID=2126335 RepID=A0A450WU59_9GAMM|nr:MAG: UDP-N-acetylmuramoylalanyl-D-glutamate--2,6-diaminopimelate ligase [Candidatus Kentron sp. LPFa]